MSRSRRRLSAYTLFDQLAKFRDYVADILSGSGTPCVLKRPRATSAHPEGFPNTLSRDVRCWAGNVGALPAPTSELLRLRGGARHRVEAGLHGKPHSLNRKEIRSAPVDT